VTVTDDDTAAVIATLARTATIGALTAELQPGSIFVWDEINELELELLSGHLSSRDENEVLAGANRIAIEIDSGAWEIVGFADAELIAPNTYRLRRLLRGQGGSDHAIGPAAAGNRVLLLDARAAVEPVDSAWLGATAELLCFTGPNDAAGVTVEADLDLAAILPLRPVHLRATAQPSGDIVLGWVRRSRSDTESWASEDAPLDQLPEAYRVEIYDGATLKRTADVSAPSFSYAPADQIADFGGPASSFGFRVAQLSPVHGPGHWANGDFNA
jgi:hypothetical protein